MFSKLLASYDNVNHASYLLSSFFSKNIKCVGVCESSANFFVKIISIKINAKIRYSMYMPLEEEVMYAWE